MAGYSLGLETTKVEIGAFLQLFVDHTQQVVQKTVADILDYRRRHHAQGLRVHAGRAGNPRPLRGRASVPALTARDVTRQAPGTGSAVDSPALSA